MLIGKKKVENYAEPYVIAEIGANHNGDLNLAQKLIDQAKEAGCDAVKFQSWTKDSLLSNVIYKEDKNLESMVEKYSLSENELEDLHQYCMQNNIDFSSTPFAEKEVDFLANELKVSFIKIASMDINNLKFIKYVANKGIPIVLSTGLSTLAEIDKALQIIESTGNKKIIILHCISNYPPDDHNINLNNIDMLRNNYPDYPVGFSDHTVGTVIPLAAVAKGVCMIEKHFTLDKNMEGWDHSISAEPEEMKQIVEGSRRIVKAHGSYRRLISEDDLKMIPAFRRSVVAKRDIPAGKKIGKEDLTLKRPGTGMEPKMLEQIAGRIAKIDIPADKLISMEDLK